MAEDRGQRGRGRQLFCRVITPEEVIYDGEANLVIARIADGDLGVLVDHSPLVSPEDIDVDAAENRIEEAERELSEVAEEAEDRDRVLAELRRRQRTGENLVR